MDFYSFLYLRSINNEAFQWRATRLLMYHSPAYFQVLLVFIGWVTVILNYIFHDFVKKGYKVLIWCFLSTSLLCYFNVFAVL